MLAEAAEYVGVDIKPYQYIKTTAVPAVSQQVKLAAETVTEGVKKITGLTVAADKTNNRPGNQAGQPDDASVKLESKKIVFETMTDDERQRLIWEVNYLLSQETPTSPAGPNDLSSDKTGNQVTGSAKLAYKKTPAAETQSAQPAPSQEPVIYQTQIKNLSPTAPDQTQSADFAHDNFLKNEPVKQPEPAQTAKAAESEIKLKETVPPTRPAADYQLLVSPQPSASEPAELKVTPVWATETLVSPPPEKQAAQPTAAGCQNKMEIIVYGKDILNIQKQSEKIIGDLGIQIKQINSAAKQVTIKINTTGDQYKKLMLVLDETTLAYEKKVLSEQSGCQTTEVTFYVLKKSSLFDWLSPKS